MSDTTISTKHIWIATGVICAALLIGLLIHGWLTQRGLDKAAIEQIIKDSLQQHQQNAQQQQQGQSDAEAARQREADNQKLLAATLAAIAAQKGQPVQPVDYARIDQIIAEHLNVNQNQVHTSTDPQTGQAVTTIPTQQYRDFQLECDAKKVGLDSCLKSIDNKNSEIAGKDVQIDALTKDNELLKKDNKKLQDVANGGSFWRRLARGAGHTACGSVGTIAGVGVANNGQGDAKTGSLVGLGSYGFCEWLLHNKKGK